MDGEGHVDIDTPNTLRLLPSIPRSFMAVDQLVERGHKAAMPSNLLGGTKLLMARLRAKLLPVTDVRMLPMADAPACCPGF